MLQIILIKYFKKKLINQHKILFHLTKPIVIINNKMNNKMNHKMNHKMNKKTNKRVNNKTHNKTHKKTNKIIFKV